MIYDKSYSNAQVSNDSCVGMKLETDLREGEYINYTT